MTEAKFSHVGEMTADEKRVRPLKGQGLSHRTRSFLKLAAACLRADQSAARTS